MLNFKEGGCPPEKVVIGFEPGDQAAGGKWEGQPADLGVAKWAMHSGFGGAFIWAVDPEASTEPDQARNAPILAAALQKLLHPGYWPGGSVPNFTRCDPKTGWLPAPSPPPPPPGPPTPPPSPPAPPPGQCKAVPGSSATDAWCQTNCHHVPPNCPASLCRCST